MTNIITFDVSKAGNKTATNDVVFVTNEQTVMESVMNLLSTEPGSRVMYDYSYGCALNRFVYETINTNTAYRMVKVIESSILRYEPRAKNLLIQVTPDKVNMDYAIVVSFVEEITQYVQKIQLTLKKIR